MKPLYSVLASVVIAVVLAIIVNAILSGKKLEATYEGAEKALDRLGDWAKWLAGIQTATLASLGLMLKDSQSQARTLPVIATVVFMGAALLCSAWVLGSIANVSLAISHERTGTGSLLSEEYDVYERPLYDGFKNSGLLKKITLNFMVTLQHTLWLAGVVAFAWFLMGWTPSKS